MALIKKYQSGSKVEKEPDFKQYMTGKLLAGDFDKKKAKEVEDYLNSGKSFDWIESEKNNYNPPTRTVSVDPRREKEIGNIWNYVVQTKYGGDEEAFADDWESQDNPERQKKLWGYVEDITSKYLKDQSEDTVGHTWDNVEDVQNIANIIAEGFSPERMEALTAATNKLGWGVNKWFVSPEELKRRQTEQSQQQEELIQKQKLEELSTTFQNLGIEENLARQLAGTGWAIDEEFEPVSDLNFMSNYVKDRGITVLKSPDGSRVYYKDGQPYSNFGGYISEDQFDPNYGKSFQVTPEGFRLFSPEQREQNQFIEDSYEDPGNLRRRLEFEDPNYEGFSFYGESGDDFRGKWNQDVLGRRDFLQRIERISPTGESQWLTRSDKGYIDSLGNVIDVPSFIRYGESEAITENEISALFENPKSLLYDIKSFNPGKAGSPGRIESLENRITKLENIPQPGKTLETNTRIKKESREVAALGRWFLENGTPEQKEQARKILSRLITLSGKYTETDETGKTVSGFLKKGGVIKAEKGMSAKDLIALNEKYFREIPVEEKAEAETKEIKKEPKIRDISGTVKDEFQQTLRDPLKAASAIGVAASFVPGVGLIGGATTTTADAIRGFRDGWDKEDWKRLGANLAFTGLAAVGLGGARLLKGASKLGAAGKTVAKSTKASKAIKTTDLITNAAKKADKVNIPTVTKPIDRLTQLTKNLGDEANTALETVFKSGKPRGTIKAGKIVTNPSEKLIEAAKLKDLYKGSNVEIATNIVKDLQKASEISKATTSAAASYARRAYEPTVNFLSSTFRNVPQLAFKTGRYGLGAANVISGGTGALDVIGSIAEEGHLGRGIQHADAASMQRMLLGAAGLRGTLKNRRNVRDLERFGERVKSNQFTVGNRSYETKSLITPRKPRFEKAATRAVKEQQHIKKQLEDNLVLKQGESREDVIKSIMDSITGGANYESTPASGWRLSENVDFGTDLYKANQTRNRIQHIIRTGNFNYMGPRYRAFKKGGVIKAQDGVKVNYNKRFINIGNYLNSARNPNTLPYTAINQTDPNWQYNAGYTPAYERLIESVDDNFYNQHIGNITEFVNKQGGKYIPKDAADLRKLMSDNKYGPIHNWVLSRFGNINNSSTGLNENAPAIEGVIPRYSGLNTYLDVIKSPVSLTADNSNETTGYDVNLRRFDRVAFQPKAYMGDVVPLATETARFGANQSYNARALRHGLAAASAVPQLSRLPYNYERTSQINEILARRQAGEMESAGKRLAESTSDLDKSLATRLESAKNKVGIILEGSHRDLEANRAIRDNQRQQNYQTGLINIQQGDTQSAVISDAIKQIHQLKYNKALADQASVGNYIGMVGKTISERPYKKALHEYSQLMGDPNIQTLQDEYRYMGDEGLQKFRNLYNQSQDWDKARTFEESKEYEAWMNEMNRITKDLQQLGTRLSRVSNIVQGQQLLLQKGGRIPLSEKITLENVKYNHKRLLKNQDNFIKSVLENNKLYQKAFIKVFK